MHGQWPTDVDVLVVYYTPFLFNTIVAYTANRESWSIKTELPGCKLLKPYSQQRYDYEQAINDNGAILERAHVLIRLW